MKNMKGKRLLWRALANFSEGDLDDYDLLYVILFICFFINGEKVMSGRKTRTQISEEFSSRRIP